LEYNLSWAVGVAEAFVEAELTKPGVTKPAFAKPACAKPGLAKPEILLPSQKIRGL
jgi:hypothetical protein